MARGSHALVHDGRVWLIDPVDSEGDVERAVGDNEPAGVIQLLDRHNRDNAAIADSLERAAPPAADRAARHARSRRSR